MGSDPLLPAGSVAEIAVSCRNLRDMDWFSKSDPFVVLFVKPPKSAQSAVESFFEFRTSHSEHRSAAKSQRVSRTNDALWVYAGETEVVWNELSPNFVVKLYLPIDVPTIRESLLRFEVYDMDKHDAPLSDQDFLGYVDTTFLSILEPQPRMRTMTLCDRRSRPKTKLGQLCTIVETYDIAPPPHYITLHTVFEVNCGVLQNDQIFYVVSRAFEHLVDGEEHWTRVYRSGPMSAPMQKREWGFQDVSLTEHHLTAGLPSRKIRIELFLYRKKGDHLRMGSSPEFTLEDIERELGDGCSPLTVDERSAAGLQSGQVFRTSQLLGRRAIDKGNLSASSSLLSSESSVQSSLAGLDTSAISFKFDNLLWHPKGRKESPFLKPIRTKGGGSFLH